MAITKYSSGLKEIDAALVILARSGNKDTLTYLDLKAILLHKDQKYEEAESLFKRILQSREKLGKQKMVIIALLCLIMQHSFKTYLDMMKLRLF